MKTNISVNVQAIMMKACISNKLIWLSVGLIKEMLKIGLRLTEFRNHSNVNKSQHFRRLIEST